MEASTTFAIHQEPPHASATVEGGKTGARSGVSVRYRYRGSRSHHRCRTALAPFAKAASNRRHSDDRDDLSLAPSPAPCPSLRGDHFSASDPRNDVVPAPIGQRPRRSQHPDTFNGNPATTAPVVFTRPMWERRSLRRRWPIRARRGRRPWRRPLPAAAGRSSPASRPDPVAAGSRSRRGAGRRGFVPARGTAPWPG